MERCKCTDVNTLSRPGECSSEHDATQACLLGCLMQKPVKAKQQIYTINTGQYLHVKDNTNKGVTELLSVSLPKVGIFY